MRKRARGFPLRGLAIIVCTMARRLLMGFYMDDLDSTLIRTGRKATSFADMVAFTQNVHDRPFEKLLVELPQIARLSDTKFNLATKVLRRRFSSQAAPEQTRLREIGGEIATSANSEWVAGRIRSIFEPDTDE